MAGAAADAGELDEQHAAAQVAERYGRRIGVDERPVGRLPAHDVVGLLGLVPQLALAQHVAVGVIRFQPERRLRLVVDAHVEDRVDGDLVRLFAPQFAGHPLAVEDDFVGRVLRFGKQFARRAVVVGASPEFDYAVSIDVQAQAVSVAAGGELGADRIGGGEHVAQDGLRPAEKGHVRQAVGRSGNREVVDDHFAPVVVEIDGDRSVVSSVDACRVVGVVIGEVAVAQRRVGAVALLDVVAQVTSGNRVAREIALRTSPVGDPFDAFELRKGLFEIGRLLRPAARAEQRKHE